MKILRMSASRVYGYLDIHVDFAEDITFLIGINGSGKTTALRIVDALIRLDVAGILSFRMDRACVEYCDSVGTVYRVEYLCDKEIVKIVGPNGEYSISKKKVELYLTDADYSQMLKRWISAQDIDDRVYGSANRPVPVFLGIDRRRWQATDGEQNVHDVRQVVRQRNESIVYVEEMIQKLYERLKKIDGQYGVELREEIAMQAFYYTSISGKLDVSSIERKASRILNRRGEILDFLDKFGMKSSGIQDVVGAFFDRTSELVRSYEKSKSGRKNRVTSMELSFELLLNGFQFDRVINLFDIIDGHTRKRDDLFKPIDSFLAAVNFFLQDSGKIVKITDIGRLGVEMKVGSLVSPANLSSGEMQVIVLFAHVILGRYNDKSPIVMIDEPELSLHLKWQKEFARKLIEHASGVQVVLATHAPEIIGDREERCRWVR